MSTKAPSTLPIETIQTLQRKLSLHYSDSNETEQAPIDMSDRNELLQRIITMKQSTFYV